MKARGRGTVIAAGLTLAVLLLGAANARASTFGSNLATAPNGSVCEFESLEPETRVCTVNQYQLLEGHAAESGLRAPFEGVIVRWSVVSGEASRGTGPVRLALRLSEGPGYLTRGNEVDLPPAPSGTRHTFPERMPVKAGQPIGLTVTVANRSTQKAGAPIAALEPGIGAISSWVGEPMKSIWNIEQGIELLLDAELEPDADRDGYGDLTQDGCPTLDDDYEFCRVKRDREPPRVEANSGARQAFLRSGRVKVRVRSSEAGRVTVAGRLEIRGGRTWALRLARRSIEAGQAMTLRPRVPGGALRAARVATRQGKRVLATLLVGVADAAENEGQRTLRVRPAEPG